MKKNTFSLICLALLCLTGRLSAQYNALQYTLPSLRVAPDAASGAMGDVGIATDAYHNSMHYNPSKLAFSERKWGLAGAFVPRWIGDIGLVNQHQYLAWLSGFVRAGKKSFLGFSHRQYAFGDYEVVDENGGSLGTGRDNESQTSIAFAYRIAKHFAASLGGSFIYASHASGQVVQGNEIKPGIAGAANLSLTYKAPFSIGRQKSAFTAGLAIRDLGSKITYTNAANKEYLPANLGIGLAWQIEFNPNHSLTVGSDVNKLLVPTPRPDIDNNGDFIPDYRQKSALSGALSSFGDAPGGFSEELKEINWAAGVEYSMFRIVALRAGYFKESYSKGDRNWYSLGLGGKYKNAGIDVSLCSWLGTKPRLVEQVWRATVWCQFE